MNRDKATKIILSRRHNRKAIERLCKYDENKTVEENAFALKTTVGNLRALIYKHNLKFKISENIKRKHYKRRIKKDYAAKWDVKKTIHENAKLLKVSLQHARHLSANLGLPYSKIYKSGFKVIWQPKDRQIETRAKMEALRSLGMTLEQIGRVFGLTRERVRQICEIK